MITAIKIYGPLRGTLKGIGRLLRCHPFHPGGYDPPQEHDKTGDVVWKKEE
jgi:putative component of membrane protein insertase Oxa1/YidC/SpoIIIJ protein YidD